MDTKILVKPLVHTTRNKFMKRFFIHIQSIYPPILFGILSFIAAYILIVFFGNICDFCTSLLIVLMSIGIPILFLDAVQRFRMCRSAYEYISAKKGKDIDNLLLLEQFSWCTRESAKAACRLYSEDLYHYARDFYTKRGFR